MRSEQLQKLLSLDRRDLPARSPRRSAGRRSPRRASAGRRPTSRAENQRGRAGLPAPNRPARPGPRPISSRPSRKSKRRSAKEGTPTAGRRLESLERLETALLARKGAIAEAISRDSATVEARERRHGGLVVQGAISHARAHLRDWMEPEDARGRPRLPSGDAQVAAAGRRGDYLALELPGSARARAARRRARRREPRDDQAAVSSFLKRPGAARPRCRDVPGGPGHGRHRRTRGRRGVLAACRSTTWSSPARRAWARWSCGRRARTSCRSRSSSGASRRQSSARRLPRDAAAEHIMAGKLLQRRADLHRARLRDRPRRLRDAFVAACKAAVAKMYPTLDEEPGLHERSSTTGTTPASAATSTTRRSAARRRSRSTPASETLDPETRKLAPTLVVDPTEDMLVMQEEIFGPILPIVTYRRIDEAIATSTTTRARSRSTISATTRTRPSKCSRRQSPAG